MTIALAVLLTVTADASQSALGALRDVISDDIAFYFWPPDYI